MTYFDLFVVGAWMFAFGWFFGAIYVQNHAETTETARVDDTETARVSEIPERCPECEAWRVPVLSGSASAAD